MYRFLLMPRWLLFHVLCVGAVVLMVNLGFWQLRRLDERQAFNERVAARIDLPAAPLGDVLAPGLGLDDGDELDELEWRHVEVSGTYLPDEAFTVVNRSQGGIAGQITVAPLQLADGRVLLVERGFVPLAQQAGPPPSGTVDVVGRLRPSQERRRGQLSDPSSGELDEVQRVDIGRLQAQLPAPAVPMYVELVRSAPAESQPFPQPLIAPVLGEGSHLSYAVQWWLFSIAVVVGWVLAVRKSVNDRRRAARPVATAAAPEPVAARPPSSG